MTASRVVYNGIEMDAEWPRRIQAAQEIRTYLIGGTAYPRIPYGSEEGGPFPEPCHDCGVLVGQYHVEFICDMEQCPRCDGQVIACDCPYDDDETAETAVELEAPNHGASTIDWKGLRKRVAGEIDGYTVLLETKNGRLVSTDDASSASQVQDVVALVIAWVHEGVPAWGTEEAVRQLAARLSERCGMDPVILLSRSPESFVGFYVRLTT